MNRLFKLVITLLIILSGSFSLSASSLLNNLNHFNVQNNDIDLICQSIRSIIIQVNGSYQITMKDVDSEGTLEIYSILGKRETAINLNSNESIVYVNLSNGIYILKVGKVTQKIVIK